MARYFIEVAYDGTAYGGFQIQKNANTIQAEITRALNIFYKSAFELTCSSRTDAGVHALQNFFHFDIAFEISDAAKNVYNLNAILPDDIAVKNLFRVRDDAHCRFDAISRTYHYYIYNKKSPFIRHSAFYYPYHLDMEKMNDAAALLLKFEDFTSFSKKKTQVKHFICNIKKSMWTHENDTLIYEVESNRFLRGMVKGLVGTMLHVGRGQMDLSTFQQIIEARDCSQADFSVASRGLFLSEVRYNDDLKPAKDSSAGLE